MSTPSTVTAVRIPHQFPHYADYPASESSFRSSNIPIGSTNTTQHTRLPYSPYGGSASTPENQSVDSYPLHPQARGTTSSITTTSPQKAENMSNSAARRKTADWNEFYKNGLPAEVIVIHDDDSSPERNNTTQYANPTQNSVTTLPLNTSNSTHYDKRRRVDDGHFSKNNVSATNGFSSAASLDDSMSTTTGARSIGDRTNSAVTYSTASTSIGSNPGVNAVAAAAAAAAAASSAPAYRHPPAEDTRAGTKRKRPTRRDDEDDEEVQGPPLVSWANYYPPPRPPIKAKDVYVKVVRDTASAADHKDHKGQKVKDIEKVDDDDGHFIVHNDTVIADRYIINRLLGQGTFGKVVEAWDRKNNKKVAVKIIRAVPKYRDASRIELRVLATLAHNDKHNRNRCIHLRDCFDYKNHICIVTDLLGMSVFDFLKSNQFVPFPSTNIQSFARQLFTSVAFLHDLNLIHTDLKPENILLVSNGYQTFTYNRTIPSSSRTVQRKANFRRVLLDTEIRLIDFGSATFEDEYHSSVVSTRHYRAPEIILNLGWSYPCDIWSIGCILVEFFTGDALFQTHDNLEHLAMMEMVCHQKIDRDIIQKVRDAAKTRSGNNAANYFLPRAYRLDYPNSETTRQSKKYVRCMKRLDETIPPNNDFNRKFLDLLGKIFVYDPKKRITAHEALKHPWFKEALQDDGTEAVKIRRDREARAQQAAAAAAAAASAERPTINGYS